MEPSTSSLAGHNLTSQRTLVITTVSLAIVLIASIATNIFLFSQTNNLSGQLQTVNQRNTALSWGTFIRNRTTYEEIAFQPRIVLANGTIQPIANGTTIIYRDVSFTYVAKNWNCSCIIYLFKVGSPAGTYSGAGWNETLRISPPASPLPKTSEVYTHHTYPRAGLAMNYNSTLVFLLVSVELPFSNITS